MGRHGLLSSKALDKNRETDKTIGLKASTRSHLMRLSEFYLPTLREDPADAEIVSHRMMFRTGMIRKVSAGIYAFLPLGWRIYRKVEAIIREEMNRAGAQEGTGPEPRRSFYRPFIRPSSGRKPVGGTNTEKNS
jgi:hypothetical protein